MDLEQELLKRLSTRGKHIHGQALALHQSISLSDNQRDPKDIKGKTKDKKARGFENFNFAANFFSCLLFFD